MTNCSAAVAVAAEWTLDGPARVRYRLDQSPAAEIKNVGANNYSTTTIIALLQISQARPDQTRQRQ